MNTYDYDKNSLAIAIENRDCDDCEYDFAKCYNLNSCRVIDGEKKNAQEYLNSKKIIENELAFINAFRRATGSI